MEHLVRPWIRGVVEPKLPVVAVNGRFVDGDLIRFFAADRL